MAGAASWLLQLCTVVGVSLGPKGDLQPPVVPGAPHCPVCSFGPLLGRGDLPQNMEGIWQDDGTRAERFAILVTGEGVEKLLGVPKLHPGTVMPPLQLCSRL
ncbi:hypothetical protein GWK47_006784 [Chionoecetes opilio]|uniref:Uncharacterized protein n=1 Tax=Chionoecetes opilio TaxID=41210 RepID=A0A8J4YFJ2_CHIOP|nr:hypothetical protein GWK47_006784 [Chionoecetes opilio]